VSPGETLCITDLGLPVDHVVAPSDAGTTIVNNAVVTVRSGSSDCGEPKGGPGSGRSHEVFLSSSLMMIRFSALASAEPVPPRPVVRRARSDAVDPRSFSR
jgi:hypothetical protein